MLISELFNPSWRKIFIESCAANFKLIKNSIICWNYLYLERQLEKITNTEDRENLLRMISAHSPMTWAHINMLGEYDFSDEKLRDSVGILPLKSTAWNDGSFGKEKNA